jgi:ABC-type branched-subunit amino acid transport system substrate-binding protein
MGGGRMKKLAVSLIALLIAAIVLVPGCRKKEEAPGEGPKVAIITGTTGFGAAGRDQLLKLAKEYGIRIVADETYAPQDTDMTVQLTKIRKSGAEALVNWSIVPGQSTVIKNARQLGLKMPLYQSHGFGNIKYVELAGEAAEGVMFPAGKLLSVEGVPADDPQKKILVDYKTQYESKYNEEVSTFGGHAYDALHLVVEALKAVGDDPAKIRDYIEAKRGFVGTAGVFNFSPTDHCGLDKNAFVMYVVKGGKFVPVKAGKPSPAVPGTTAAVPAPAQAPTLAPYKVGAIFAVTGPASWLGEPEKKTVEMIVEQVNAAGGDQRTSPSGDRRGYHRHGGGSCQRHKEAHR